MQFVLGALDPEMHTIEAMLAKERLPFVYAKVGARRLVSGNAYVADN